MKNDYANILNLIHSFAASFDAGDFEDALRLFDNGEFLLGNDRKASAEDMLATWLDILILYDGSPRTRHTVTNHIVDIDAVAGCATCASSYTVLQQVPGGSLETILTGRYFDTFRCRNRKWEFRTRDYRHVEFVGDTTRHLKPHMAAQLKVVSPS